MAKSELVYLGIRGSVVAMDKNTGARVWETKLKGGGFVTVFVDRNQIFAGTHGEIFCLDAANGKILWYDGLSGYGFGLMSIATKNGSAGIAAAAAEEARRQESSADAGGAAAVSS